MDSVQVPGHSKAVICDREVIVVTLKHTLPRSLLVSSPMIQTLLGLMQKDVELEASLDFRDLHTKV